MIEIKICTYFIKEFEYVAKIIFDNILGIPYKITECTKNKNIIIRINSSTIIFPGDFWNLNEYLRKENLPTNITFANNQFVSENDIPVIYGIDLIRKEKQNIFCGIDIFASCFFMLSRWEEYVSDIRDEHGRFPGAESIAYKNNFLHRPVVNEYSELLWRILIHIGYNGDRKKREFTIIPTHDIDQLYYYDKRKKTDLLKNLLGDIYLRKHPGLFGSRLVTFASFMLGSRDPSDTLEYLMKKAESIGCKAHFYFIAGGSSVYENNYSIFSVRVKKKIESIIKRGHIIGIHPSYATFNNHLLLSKEISDLTKIAGIQIEEGRNHYLRFEIPATWKKLEQAGFQIDSSVYYSDSPGFRCGICNEFPVFDILQRKELHLIERPLIVMDTTFKNKDPESVYSEITSLKETVRKYSGDFVFLWHNSNINTPEWKGYKRTFEKVLYGE